MRLLIVLIGIVWSSFAFAQGCPDLKLDGDWRTEDGMFAFHHRKSYRIAQTGCQVLIFDKVRKATWKVDLAGREKIKTPAETVKTNLDGSGPIAARNIENLEIALVPRAVQESYFYGDLVSDVSLDAHQRFPLGLKAHIEAALIVSGSPSCSSCWAEPGRIRVQLSNVEFTDITEGLPHGMEKASFLSGANTVAKLFLGAYRYRMDVLSLVKLN